MVEREARCSARTHARERTIRKTHQSSRLSLTKERIGEAVPPTAAVTDQPSAVQAGGETERRPEHAHQDVAHADVEQDAVDWRPKAAELDEQGEDQEVAEDARHQDEAQADGHHRVAGAAQSTLVVGRRRLPGCGCAGAEAGARRRAGCGAEVIRPNADDHI